MEKKRYTFWYIFCSILITSAAWLVMLTLSLLNLEQSKNREIDAIRFKYKSLRSGYKSAMSEYKSATSEAQMYVDYFAFNRCLLWNDMDQAFIELQSVLDNKHLDAEIRENAFRSYWYSL